MSEDLLQAFEQVCLDPVVWCVVIASACYGVFLGAMPGLTATMGVALFVPVTYWMDPVPALAGIVTMVACAIFAGDIPTTLVRIPGTPASAAYADDAYALAQRGEAGRALGTSLWFSVTGGLLGGLVLMFSGHQLARLAAWFSVTEYFWLYLMGLSCAVVVGRFGVARSLAGPDDRADAFDGRTERRARSGPFHLRACRVVSRDQFHPGDDRVVWVVGSTADGDQPGRRFTVVIDGTG